MKLVSSALVLLMILSGCTQNNSKQNENPETVITLNAKSGVLTGSADFGVFAHNSTSTKLVTFTLKNDGTEPLTGPVSLDMADQGFSISYTNCPASLAKTKSCSIKVTFDPRNVSSGNKTSNLNFDSVFVNLTAIKEAPPAPETITLVGQAQFQMASVLVTAVDFGELAQKDSVLKSLTIKNVGTGVLNANTISLTGTDFILSYDACSGKSLAKGASCSIKVSLSGAGKEGVVSSTLSYGDISLALSGKVITPATAAVDPNSSLKANIQLLDGSSVASSSKNVGSFSGAQSVIISLSAKNTGTLAATAATAQISDAINFALSYNTCNNVALAVNATCAMKVTFGASGKTPGNYSTTLSFAGQSIVLNATVTAAVPTCAGGTHLEDNVCVSNSRNCLTLPTGATAGTETWTGTGYGACIVSSCNVASYHLAGGICESNVKTCDTLPLGTSGGSQTWNGTSFGTCVASSCSPGYELQGAICVVVNSGTLMAREYLPVLDSDAGGLLINNSMGLIYKNNNTALAVMDNLGGSSFKSGLYLITENNGNVSVNRLRQSSALSSYANSANYFLLPEKDLYNKPAGNYVYYREAVSSSNNTVITSYNVIQVDLNTGSVVTIMSNLPTSFANNYGGNSVDIGNKMAVVGGASFSDYNVVNENGVTLFSLTSQKLYDKGVTLSSYYGYGYLNPQVIFVDNRIYFYARPSINSPRPSTLYFCDISSSSPNSCSGATTPFGKILGADQRDPADQFASGNSYNLSNLQFKVGATLKGRKIYYEGVSDTLNYMALYSYNLDTGVVTFESPNAGYIYANDLNTVVKYNNSLSPVYYFTANYDSFLSGEQSYYTTNKYSPSSPSSSSGLQTWYVVSNNGAKTVLESYDMSNLIGTELLNSGTNIDSSFIVNMLNGSNGLFYSGNGIRAKMVSDNRYIYYIRKSLQHPSEMIDGQVSYSEFGNQVTYGNIYKELVRYDLVSGSKIVMPEFLTQVESSGIVSLLGYNLFDITGSGPILRFDENGTSELSNLSPLTDLVYGNPKMFLGETPFFNGVRSLNTVDSYSKISLYYKTGLKNIDPTLDWLDSSKNMTTVNVTWSNTNKNASFSLGTSKLTTTEGYKMVTTSSNNSVSISQQGSVSFGNADYGSYFNMNYNSWNGNPIVLDVAVTTLDTNRSKHNSVTVNIQCASGASFDANKQCVCADNNTFYNNSYCGTKCQDGVWNNSSNTCDCNDPSATYVSGSGPNGMGGYCRAASNCSEPWNIWDPNECMSCGYYWDWGGYQCM